MTQQSKLLDELKPTIVKWINASGRAGGGGTSGTTGTIDRSQAPWVATDIAAAISAHEGAADPHPQYVHVSNARNITASHIFANTVGFTSPDADARFIMGRALVGSVGYNDWAGFAHRAMASEGNYALIQHRSAGTILNGPPSTFVSHRINNSNVMKMDATSLQMAAEAAPTVKSDNYASQTTGWAIGYDGAADVRYLFTDQLHAKVFVADLERALAGIEIIAKSVTLLGADFKLPYAGASTTIVVRDLPSATGMQVFEPGDYINPPTFSRSGGGLDIGDCWGTVSNPFNLGDGTQRWTFTRSGTTTYNTIARRASLSPTSSSGTSVVINRPTGTANGDFLLASFFTASTVSATPSGWTLLNSSPATGGTLYAYYKFASSEPSSWTWTTAASGAWAGDCHGWTNVATFSPVDVSAFTTAIGTGMLVSGVTPSSAAGMMIFIGGIPANIRATPPSGMTEITDFGTASGASIYMANQLLSVSTFTGAKSATLASSSVSAVALIVLSPTYSSMSAIAGAAFPGTTLQSEKGQNAAVLDYGTSGNGYIEHNAIDGIYAINSPYTQIVTWDTHPYNKTVRSRLGNLKGIFGVTGEYGLYVGDGFGVTNKYLRLSSYTQESHNIPIKMYNGSTLFMQADTSGLTYYVPQASSAVDQTSVLFKTTGGTNIFRLSGFSNLSDGREASVRIHPGASDSTLTLLSEAPTGQFASTVIQNTVGSTSKQWIFKQLASGTYGADFSGYLSLTGDAVAPTNHYGQLLIEPTNDDRDTFISIRTTRGSNRTWLVGAGNGVPADNFRIYDLTAVADRFVIDSSGVVGINLGTPAISDGVGVDVNGKILRLRTQKTPASASATGNAGEICADSNYIYYCTATNTWKRAALSTW